MFCNHRLLQILQDENYIEEMPQWSYDVTNEEVEEDNELAIIEIVFLLQELKNWCICFAITESYGYYKMKII